MRHRPLGQTGLEILPLVLGGNVFGWTADEAASHSILDAFVAGGGNCIDTADVYSNWVPGHRGGESETVIGSWLARRGRRVHLGLGAGHALLHGRLLLLVEGDLDVGR